MPRSPSFIRTPSFVPENRSGQEERTSRYDPNREAQLARLLSSGQGSGSELGNVDWQPGEAVRRAAGPEAAGRVPQARGSSSQDGEGGEGSPGKEVSSCVVE